MKMIVNLVEHSLKTYIRSLAIASLPTIDPDRFPALSEQMAFT